MQRLIFIFFISFLILLPLNAYETEDKIKALLLGKISKYIKWKTSDTDNFKITIINNSQDKLFYEMYNDKNINDKIFTINYIDNISQIKDTDILYISADNSHDLENILQEIKGKNILSVSDIRGFAEKGGIVQIYFLSQKPKLKINLDEAKRESFKISSSLLRIVEVIHGDMK